MHTTPRPAKHRAPAAHPLHRLRRLPTWQAGLSLLAWAPCLLASAGAHAEEPQPGALAPAEASSAEALVHTKASSAEALADGLLAALHETSGVPGLSAAVWHAGRLRWLGQAGWQDLARQRPLGPETRLRLASVSKVFAATAAALLHQEGRLDGEAPLPTPWYPAGHPGAGITPRQLASHLSGLPHYEAADLGRGRQAHADSRQAAEHWLGGRALLDAPGRRYHYSSWGYTLLGAAIEEASGLPLADFIQARVAPGLALGPDRTDSEPGTHSRAYEPSATGWRLAPAHDYSYSLGGAGLSATPSALAEWGGRLLQGEVLNPQTLAWMTRPSRLSDGSTARHGADAVAFGWRLHSDSRHGTTWFHNGSTLGARSALVLWPASPAAPATAAALLSNASWVSDIDDSARTLAAVFRPAPAVAAGPAPHCPTPGLRFAGRWGEQVVQGRVWAHPDMPGPCARRLVLDTAPAGFDNGGPPRTMPALGLLLLPPQAGPAQAALATPIGLFLLEASEPTLWVGSVAGRAWTLRFEGQSGP